MPDRKDHTIGVVLLNMGGPDRLEDVEPFLVNLFSDRTIIRLGPFPFLQKFIARRIAGRRAPKSREAYGLIGGGSPLARMSAEQGRALEGQLAAHGSFKVCTAMRYWRPFASEALSLLERAGIQKVVALPLYPHYSRATSGSSLDDLRKAAALFAEPFTIAPIEAWPDQLDYIAALADTIMTGMLRFAGRPAQLVYSAHSLPVKFIKEGDPYLDHIKKTIAALEKKTGIAGVLCFQSRSGPVEWLTPSTPEMLADLAEQGCENILMVPISFVSDHVETLYEIDILYRDLARSLGMRLERPEALNVRPDFIQGLAALVLEACRHRNWRETER